MVVLLKVIQSSNMYCFEMFCKAMYLFGIFMVTFI